MAVYYEYFNLFFGCCSISFVCFSFNFEYLTQMKQEDEKKTKENRMSKNQKGQIKILEIFYGSNGKVFEKNRK